MLNIVNCIGIIIFIVCWFQIIRKLILSRYSSVKCIKAKVVDKYVSTPVSKHPGTQKRKYTVVFEAENRRHSFAVSEFTYGNYRIGDKGNLRYKGNRIINFD